MFEPTTAGLLATLAEWSPPGPASIADPIAMRLARARFTSEQPGLERFRNAASPARFTVEETFDLTGRGGILAICPGRGGKRWRWCRARQDLRRDLALSAAAAPLPPAATPRHRRAIREAGPTVVDRVTLGARRAAYRAESAALDES